MAHWQVLEAAGEAAAQQRWHPAKTPLQLGGEAMAVVPPKQFIASITREGHREATAARFPADQMGGQLRGVGERFAVELGQLRDQGAGILGRKRYFGVISTEMGGNRCGIGRFVEARFSAAGIREGDGETAHRPIALGLEQGRDQRGIHPTGEEGAEGHIGKGLLRDHLLESALELIENILL